MERCVEFSKTESAGAARLLVLGNSNFEETLVALEWLSQSVLVNVEGQVSNEKNVGWGLLRGISRGGSLGVEVQTDGSSVELCAVQGVDGFLGFSGG